MSCSAKTLQPKNLFNACSMRLNNWTETPLLVRCFHAVPADYFSTVVQGQGQKHLYVIITKASFNRRLFSTTMKENNWMIVAKLFKLTFYGILVRRKIVIYGRQHIRGKVVLFIKSFFSFSFAFLFVVYSCI